MIANLYENGRKKSKQVLIDDNYMLINNNKSTSIWKNPSIKDFCL